jgi:5-methylcytosine-specific restriction enzyme A
MPKKRNPQSMTRLGPGGWYRTARWKKIAAAQLKRQPLCQRCAERGLTMAAAIAHHVDGHPAGETWEQFLFARLESLCADCHAGRERNQRAGYIIGPDGYPRSLTGEPLVSVPMRRRGRGPT